MDKLISQQAAIDKITKRLFETAFNNIGVKQNIDETLADVAENRLENWFNELPSVQSERKTGRWIEMSSTNHTYKCSECGRLLVNITDGKNKVAKNYPYCHCGADMRPTERNMGKEQRNIRGKRENRNDKTRAVR